MNNKKNLQLEFETFIKNNTMNLDETEIKYLTNETIFKDLIIKCMNHKGFTTTEYPFRCSIDFLINMLGHSDYCALAEFIKHKFKHIQNDFRTKYNNYTVFDNYKVNKDMIYRLQLKHLMFINENEFRSLIKC